MVLKFTVCVDMSDYMTVVFVWWGGCHVFYTPACGHHIPIFNLCDHATICKEDLYFASESGGFFVLVVTLNSLCAVCSLLCFD